MEAVRRQVASTKSKWAASPLIFPGFHAAPGWIGFSSTIDSISTNGSADAAQQSTPPSRFTMGPSGGQAPGSASASPAEGCEGQTILNGLSPAGPRVTRDFIGL